VNVVDRGPGIPEDFHERIFERFSQADSSTTRRAGGTGLGLHISRQIVERMNGTIGFESQVGRGTTFWVDFPLADA
jgi:signal transduction histidine kinase